MYLSIYLICLCVSTSCSSPPCLCLDWICSWSFSTWFVWPLSLCEWVICIYVYKYISGLKTSGCFWPTSEEQKLHSWHVLHHLSMALCNNTTPVFSYFKMLSMLPEWNVSLLASESEMVVGEIVVLRKEKHTFGHGTTWWGVDMYIFLTSKRNNKHGELYCMLLLRKGFQFSYSVPLGYT